MDSRLPGDASRPDKERTSLQEKACSAAYPSLRYKRARDGTRVYEVIKLFRTLVLEHVLSSKNVCRRPQGKTPGLPVNIVIRYYGASVSSHGILQVKLKPSSKGSTPRKRNKSLKCGKDRGGSRPCTVPNKLLHIHIFL